MTEEQIKEKISNAFVRVIANNSGYKLTVPDDTGGVDFMVTYDTIMIRAGKQRHIQSGNIIELQMKATENHSVVFEEDHLKFDLEAKTYNDLIDRFEMGNAPLVLIVAILPDDRTNWATCSDTVLSLAQKAYYFYPTEEMESTNNVASKRISIPFTNQLNTSFFQDLFAQHYGI